MNSDNSKTKAELIHELQSIRKRLNSGGLSTNAEVEKKPELSERKYQELFENSADAILIIQDGIFIDCNKATVEMLRYNSKEELLKTHPSELSPEKQPDGRSSFEKADEMMAIALEKGSHRFEWSHIRSDNEVFPVEVLLTPIHTSDDSLIIHTVWRDITERKLAEKELLKAKKAAEESQERYRILSDATIEGITIHDKGIIVDGSDSFVELFGYDSLDEMIGMNVVDLVSEDSREIIRRNSKAGNEMPYEARGLRKDNTTFPIIVNGKDIPIEGKTYRIASIRDISEQKQAEAVLNNLPVGYNLFDMEGKVITVNSIARSYFGVAQDDPLTNYRLFDDPSISENSKLKIKNGETVVEERFIDFHAIKDHQMYETTKTIDDKLFIRLVYRAYGPKNNPSGIIVIIQDLTERKMAEIALEDAKNKTEESESRLRNYFEIGLLGMAITSLEKGWIEVNDALLELLGYTREELNELTWLDLTHKDDINIDVEHFNRVLKGEIDGYRIDKRYINKQGNIIPTELAVRCIRDSNNEVKYFLALINDITSRKKAEAQLKEYSENLEEMVNDRTRKLEDAQNQLIRKEKLASLGQLAGSVGHELRNPLGVISNSVYYLNNFVDLDDTAKEQLEMITHEVKTSTRIISELLDFGKVPIANKEKIYLSEFVDQIIKKQQLPDNIELIIEIESTFTALNADPLHLEQVMVNLIWNACQAMPQGGKLIVEALSKKNKTIIKVTDTGKGIPKKNIDKIFEPLFTTRAKGIGLGLSVSKNLVEANGGIITFNNTEGLGVTFTMEFSEK